MTSIDCSKKRFFNLRAGYQLSKVDVKKLFIQGFTSEILAAACDSWRAPLLLEEFLKLWELRCEEAPNSQSLPISSGELLQQHAPQDPKSQSSQVPNSYAQCSNPGQNSHFMLPIQPPNSQIIISSQCSSSSSPCQKLPKANHHKFPMQQLRITSSQ